MGIEPADSTTYLVQKVGHQALASLEASLAGLGITARHFIVLVLASHADQPAQVEIAAKLGVDATVLGRILDDLEARELVVRQRAPRDRRRHELFLTKAGERLLARADRRRQESEERFFGRLGAEQTELFHAILRRLLDLPSNR